MRTRAVIRFHLDENVHHAVARGLKLRGIDVSTTTDANLTGASDVDQFAFAMSVERVLFTHDADFLRSEFTGRQHHGIVFSPKNKRSIGEIVRYLDLMARLLEANDMLGQVEIL